MSILRMLKETDPPEPHVLHNFAAKADGLVVVIEPLSGDTEDLLLRPAQPVVLQIPVARTFCLKTGCTSKS